MPYKGVDDDQKNLVDYARGGEPPTVPKFKGATPHASIREEIVHMLEELLADIRSGNVIPSHLMIGWGEKIDINGKPGTAYMWDATGLETPELIGHLTTYATKLAMGEGE